MDINKLRKFESEQAIPHAGSMIESFRSIGYNLSTAVADIIDNSIAAQANNVWIDFQWAGPETVLVITDDGEGMDKTELVDAMRPGSKNPLADRSSEDLGRFGLGLKTASFSQCRILTVASKKEGQSLLHRCWNLDYVGHTGEWKLLDYLNKPELTERLNSLAKGTCVIWDDIDTLIKDTSKKDENDVNNFLDKIKLMEKHLQMVFHLFLEDRRLNVWINDNKIAPWDPYITTNEHSSLVNEYELRDEVQVKSWVLPHHSKLKREDFETASWLKGWNAHQGFYIYRKDRLIIAGEWLGMYKQEEHSKLARIMVNVPNTSILDKEWQLDIKKSTIQPPNDIRKKLKKIAEEARKEATDVYRQIGKMKRSKSEKEDTPVWLPHKWNGKRCYQINKEHPIIKSFLDEFSDNKSQVRRLFRLIEETLPLAMIIINESENKNNQNIPFEGKSISDLVSLVINLYQHLIKQGYTEEEAIEEILRTEPFNYYPELSEHLESQIS
ncbi:MAG: ATP-binding protein [Balneola sp.]